MTTVRRAVFNADVLAVHKPGLPQPLLECGCDVLGVSQ